MKKICSLLMVLFISFGFITNTYAHKGADVCLSRGGYCLCGGLFCRWEEAKEE